MAKFAAAVIVASMIAAGFCFGKGNAIRCSVCSSADFSCSTHPPAPVECPSDHNFCVGVTYSNRHGHIIRHSKGCSRTWSSHICIKFKMGRATLICYEFCSTNDCNSSYGLHSVFDFP